MASLDDLKKRIKSVKSTQKITKAMKMVAAAKLRKAQESAEKGRPFSEKMNNIILNLSKSISDKDNASKFLVGTRKDNTHLCVVITADRGLCGGFNTNICRKAKNYFDKILKENKTLKIFTVGSKGYDQLKRIYGKYIIEKINFKGSRKITYKEAENVGKIIIRLFNESQFDICKIFYNKFKNVITQIPQEQQIIPIENQKKKEEKSLKIFTVGYKGHDQLKRIYGKYIIEKINFKGFRKITYKEAENVGKIIIRLFNESQFDICKIFYNKFKNVITQIPQEQQLIPAESGKREKEKMQDNFYEFEPEENEILNDLLPRNISAQIFKAFLENGASEQGSRMTAMDNATRNAGDLVDKLTINYNRSRQAAITKELIEIISGAESL